MNLQEARTQVAGKLSWFCTALKTRCLILQFTGSGEISLQWFSWCGLLFWHYRGCWCMHVSVQHWMANPAVLWELPDTPLLCVALHQQQILVLWQLAAQGNIGLGVQMIRIHPASALKDGRWEHICCLPPRDGTCLAPKWLVLGECCTLWMLPPAQSVLCFCSMSSVLCFATLQCQRSPVAVWHRDVPDCSHNRS